MRKRPRPDQIAAILRDFQADLDAGLNINHACRKAGIGPTTYYYPGKEVPHAAAY